MRTYEQELEDRVADLENAQAERIRLLQLAAAGRREYAGPNSDIPHHTTLRRSLLSEAEILDCAVRIVEGDVEPLYGLLPSWMWEEAGLS